MYSKDGFAAVSPSKWTNYIRDSVYSLTFPCVYWVDLCSLCAICSQCIFLYLIFTLQQNNWLWGCPSMRNYLSVLYNTWESLYFHDNICVVLFVCFFFLLTCVYHFTYVSWYEQKKKRIDSGFGRQYAAEMCIFNALGLSLAKQIASPDCRTCISSTKLLTNKWNLISLKAIVRVITSSQNIRMHLFWNYLLFILFLLHW